MQTFYPMIRNLEVDSTLTKHQTVTYQYIAPEITISYMELVGRFLPSYYFYFGRLRLSKNQSKTPIYGALKSIDKIPAKQPTQIADLRLFSFLIYLLAKLNDKAWSIPGFNLFILPPQLYKLEHRS